MHHPPPERSDRADAVALPRVSQRLQHDAGISDTVTVTALFWLLIRSVAASTIRIVAAEVFFGRAVQGRLDLEERDGLRAELVCVFAGVLLRFCRVLPKEGNGGEVADDLFLDCCLLPQTQRPKLQAKVGRLVVWHASFFSVTGSNWAKPAIMCWIGFK